MYKGIKRKVIKKIETKPIQTKHQIIVEEEVETNGIISMQYKVKTHDYKADKNIKYTDFEVNNLLSAGIDVQKMPSYTLHPNTDKLERNAATANEVMEQYEIIKELEQTKPQENGTE